MKRLVIDIEADSLRPKQIWCVCYKDLDTGSTGAWHEDTKEECKRELEGAELIIGHNIIQYDLPVLKQLWGVDTKVSQVYDTLVASRLADPKRENGHSLREWGSVLGFPKGDCDDFSHWSESMESYCHRDVLVTEKVYNRVRDELAGFSPYSVKIEMRSQWILSMQHYNGFDFDMDAAIALKNQMESEYFVLINRIREAFPPRKHLIGTYTARRKKDGTFTAKSAEIIMRPNVKPTDTKDVYNVWEEKEFIIDSPSEIRERLAPYWHPVIWNKPTKTGEITAKVCDTNLETVGDDAPEAIKDIVKCKILKSRSTLVQSFIDACWEDGRVHGDVISCGASSHRMAHRNPNVANLASFKSLYGKEVRSLFRASKGNALVGCDLCGIQLRALAHYTGDQELAHQILNGDIHVFMAKLYGLLPQDVVYDEHNTEHAKARAKGKTVTYAILMGAGAARIGQILGLDADAGRAIMNRMESGLHGWKKFKAQIEVRAKIGWFTALDGRRVKLPNAHLGVSYYLQSFEQAIIKLAMYKYHQKLKKLGVWFKQVNVVHDELICECHPEDADVLGKTIEEAMTEAGEALKVKIRIDGEYKKGVTWLDTH